jgi:hypothetical protein
MTKLASIGTKLVASSAPSNKLCKDETRLT